MSHPVIDPAVVPLPTSDSEEEEAPRLTPLQRITHLEQELLRYAERNSNLENDNEELRDRLRQSELTIKHLLEVVEVSNRGRSTVLLPHEVLKMIFLRVVPPAHFLDRSMNGNPDSSWHRSVKIMKSMVLVSRDWWKVGTELLYEDVVFHNIGQVAAFARTLDTRSGLGSLVKTIIIHCSIPIGCESVYAHDLHYIFACCPLVRQVSYDPLLYSGHTQSRIGTISQTVIRDYWSSVRVPLSILPLNLTHLEIGGNITMGPLGYALSTLHVLESLKINLLMHDRSLESGSGLLASPISLKCLGSLWLGVGKNFLASFQSIGAHWSMPSLERLRVDIHSYREAAQYVPMFLQMHGKQLTYLHVHPCCDVSTLAAVNFQAIPRTCPMLKHIVLFHGVVLPTQHPQVEWVDVWSQISTRQATELRRLRTSLTTEIFPCLKKIRQLDSGLSCVADWPLVFPPDADIDNPGFEYKFPGVHIQVTATSVSRMDLRFLDGQDLVAFLTRDGNDQNDQRDGVFTDEPDYLDDSSDESYEPPESDEENSSTTTGWSSDQSIMEEDEDEDLESDVLYLDREAILQIYCKTL